MAASSALSRAFICSSWLELCELAGDVADVKAQSDAMQAVLKTVMTMLPDRQVLGDCAEFGVCQGGFEKVPVYR